jgi:hypothetical protein
MVVHCPPSRRRSPPDEREPAGLLGLAAAGECPARRRERYIRPELAHRELLEAELLNGLSVLEVMVAECLFDGRDARAAARPSS